MVIDMQSCLHYSLCPSHKFQILHYENLKETSGYLKRDRECCLPRLTVDPPPCPDLELDIVPAEMHLYWKHLCQLSSVTHHIKQQKLSWRKYSMNNRHCLGLGAQRLFQALLFGRVSLDGAGWGEPMKPRNKPALPQAKHASGPISPRFLQILFVVEVWVLNPVRDSHPRLYTTPGLMSNCCSLLCRGYLL